MCWSTPFVVCGGTGACVQGIAMMSEPWFTWPEHYDDATLVARWIDFGTHFPVRFCPLSYFGEREVEIEGKF